jgi:predicted Zn-dependent protease
MTRGPSPVATALAACAASLAACATNPATGSSEISLMSEAQEIQLGKELDAEVRRTMRTYDDPELQSYVEQIGLRLAAVSPRPSLPWHFTIVDQTAVNAFALPGGYIYITRGILPFLDSEAELAGVVGHEIAHVAARHAARAYTRSTEANIGLSVLSIFVPGARPFTGLADTAFGVLFLKHSRNDELQADRLGADYAAKGGWDPHGLAGMLATLSRLDEADSSSRGVPGWLSTHPDPGDRVQRVQPAIQQAVAAATMTRLRVGRDEYLERIDGLAFGDDPQEGVVRGSEFLHAGLRFRLTFPDGWEVVNTEQQVAARLPGEPIYLILQLVEDPSGTLQETAVANMRQAGLRLAQGDATDIQGLRAFVGTYRGKLEGIGDTQVRAAHIAYDRRVFLIAGLAPTAAFQRVEADFARSISSFRPMSRDEAARLRPNRLDYYVVRAGDTWQSIAARAGGGNVKATLLAIMNHYAVNEQPRPGERVKIVVSG